jgi:hypothetical protein
MPAAVTESLLRRVFAPGTLITVRPRDGVPGMRLAGLVAAWKRGACRLDLRASSAELAGFEGLAVEMLHGRLDGLYSVAGELRACAPGAAAPEAATITAGGTRAVWLRVAAETAECRQRRAYYRLPGAWPALIHLTPSEGPGRAQAAAGAVAACVHDLSAGGMLIDDRQALLRPGARLRATLDLQDGEMPLTVSAVAVRRHAARAGGPRQWGCRFVDLPSEAQERIIGRLHVLTRARLAGSAQLPPAPL